MYFRFGRPEYGIFFSFFRFKYDFFVAVFFDSILFFQLLTITATDGELQANCAMIRSKIQII